MANEFDIRCSGAFELIPFQTTITNQGVGVSGSCSLGFTFLEENRTVGLSLGYQGMDSDIKRFTSGFGDIVGIRPDILGPDFMPVPEIISADYDFFRLGITDATAPWEQSTKLHLNTSITRYFGLGHAATPVRTVNLGGEDVEVDGAEGTLWQLSKQMEKRLTYYFSDSSWNISLSAGLLYGALFENNRSDFNRVLFSPMISLGLGWGAKPTGNELDADRSLTFAESTLESFNTLFDWLMSLMIRKAIITPNSDIASLGLSEGKVEPETSDVPPILGAVFFLTTNGDSTFHNLYLRSNLSGKIALMVAKSLGGLGSMIDNALEEPLPQLQPGIEDNRPRNVNGYIATVADVLTLANSLLYSIMNVNLDDPGKMGTAGFIRFLVDGGVMVVGGIITSADPTSDAGKVIASAGAQATFGLALSPFPLEKSDALKNTRYSLFVPNLSVDEEAHGPSMGFRLTNYRDREGFGLYSSATFITPTAQLDNRYYQRTSVTGSFGINVMEKLSDDFTFESEVGLALSLTYPQQLAAIGLEGVAGIEYGFLKRGGENLLGIGLEARLGLQKTFGPGFMFDAAPMIGLRVHDDLTFEKLMEAIFG